MANFTKIVSNSVNCFGPAPCTKWGTNNPYTMTWGSSKWGETTEDLIVCVGRLLSGQSITISETTPVVSVGYFRSFLHSIPVIGDLTSEGLGTGNGYSYVFVKPSTNAEERNLSTYSSQSAGNTIYTSASVAATTWS